MSLSLSWFHHRAPVTPSPEALADAAKATRQRQQVDLRWPDVLEKSGLQQIRLAENHIAPAIDQTFVLRESK